MINEKELKKEKDYLKAVLYVLEKELAKSKAVTDENADNVQEDMRYVWDATNRISDTEFEYGMRRIQIKSIVASDAANKHRNYTKMLKSAYFARIDFETEGEVIPAYIGIATLESGGDFYIYDWRAPISSLFYDYELGDASYSVPNGETVSGKITLKRQYKIEGDKIKQIFDTDMQVIDSILQQMLGNNATSKMKNIVNTIQKEQNKIIRKNDVDILVVQGPAGSGKTSVAMHKVAYLLYSERGKINNSNILIMSPNEIFSNYISGVLPEIGEDNVYETTYMDFVKAFLTEFRIKGNMNDVYETVFSEDGHAVKSTEYAAIKLKLGAVYINLIEDFLKLKRTEILGLDDIKVAGKTIITKDYLTKLADEFEVDGLSMLEQCKKLVEKINLHANIKLNKETGIRASLKKALESNIKKVKAKSLYLELYSDENRFISMIENIYNTTGTLKANRLSIKELHDIFAETKQNLEKSIIDYADVSGYMYLKDRLTGLVSQSKIKYVLIDEAQDYTIMQYKVLAHLFKKAKMTILGDLNQSILPFYAPANYNSILNVLSSERNGASYDTKYLTKTYRSTYEINMFAKHLLGETNLYNQVDRHGDEVAVIKDRELGAEPNAKLKIIEDALVLKKYYNTIAIITKTAKDARDLKNHLEGKTGSSNFKVIQSKDKVFDASKIMIIPSYLSKGLEFDAVLVMDANDDKYRDENKLLLYTVCTRALHKLNVYYSKELTKLIKIK